MNPDKLHARRFDIRELALEKSQADGNLNTWLQCLESARLSLRLCEIEIERLEEIVRASETPAHFTTLIRVLYRESKTHPGEITVLEDLCEAASRSAFPLGEWIEALYVFERWADENHRHVDFGRALAYVKCSAELPDGQLPGQRLPALVKEALDVYGLE